jgi:NhaP-type Na+/H+ and K+/H+ antiporter
MIAVDDDDEVRMTGGEKNVVSHASIKDVGSGEVVAIDCAAVFVAIGRTGQINERVEGLVDFNTSHNDYVQVIAGTTLTSVTGSSQPVT